MHHSLPHRTRILNALAGLRWSENSAAGLPAPSSGVEPTVVIHPGRAGSAPNPRRQVLGAADLPQYVIEMGGDDLLTRRALPRMRQKARGGQPS